MVALAGSVGVLLNAAGAADVSCSHTPALSARYFAKKYGGARSFKGGSLVFLVY